MRFVACVEGRAREDRSMRAVRCEMAVWIYGRMCGVALMFSNADSGYPIHGSRAERSVGRRTLRPHESKERISVVLA